MIPQALGNRLLLSAEECDECNEHVGSVVEGDLVGFLGVGRVLSRLPHPSSKYKVKARRQGGHLERTRKGADNTLSVAAVAGDDSVTLALSGNEAAMSVLLPSFRPMNVARSIARMGLLTVPAGYLPQLEAVRTWVRREVALPCVLTRFSTIRGESRVLRVSTYRRRGFAASDWAPWFFCLEYSRYMLVVHTRVEKFNLPGRYPTPCWFSGDVRPEVARFVIERDEVEVDAREEFAITHWQR